MYLKFAGLQHIKTSIAYPQSNWKIEIFRKIINNEHLKKTSFINLEDARKKISDYIEFYNTKRLHSSLFYLIPNDYLNDTIKQKLDEKETKLQEGRNNRIEIRNAV